MAGVAVVTDSTSSLAPEQAAAAGVTIIPLQVVIDEVSRPETDTEASPAVVAAALRRGRPVTTSRPTPEAFRAVFAELAQQGFEGIVSAHLSSEMSATCEAAEVAAATSPVPVIVVDTRTLAMAAGFAVLAGADAAARGADARTVADLIQDRARHSQTYFCVDNLEYLRRGGRIGAAAAMLGGALAVKPLLRVHEGEVQPFERVRTASKAQDRLLELAVTALGRAAEQGAQVEVAVHHLDNRVGAERLVGQLHDHVAARFSAVTISVSEVSAVLGVHVGPGTLGVVIAPY